MWTLFKREINQYIFESKKNDNVNRIGLNALNFLHNLKISHIYQEVGICIDNLEKKKPDIPDTLKWLRKMQEWVEETNNLKETMTKAVLFNRTLDRQKIDIHEKLDSIFEYAYLNIDISSNIRIKKNYAPEKILYHAIPYEIHFLFQNIINNAIEAMLNTGETGYLTITTNNRDNMLTVIIEDTGPGFPEKNGIVQLKSSRKTGGYGLEYVQEILRKYGGKATFKNNEQGAAVTIQLPVKELKNINMQILIIAENNAYQEWLENKLKAKFRHSIITACNNPEAMRKIQEQAKKKRPVQLVIMDYTKANERQTVEFTKELKQEFPELLRMAIMESENQAVAIIETGIYDYIFAKTFQDKDFENAITTIMASLASREYDK